MNPTVEKFGHPATLLRELDHWVVLLRPGQVTFGSLVLAAKSSVTSYSMLPDEAFLEQAQAVRTIERALSAVCQYERINYLMLMMVDPNVHFHVIPRYPGVRTWVGTEFPDMGWPGPPALGNSTQLSGEQVAKFKDDFAAEFS